MPITERQTDNIIDPRGGANLQRVRAYNERLVLALVRRHGSLSRSEIARRSGLSPQTVSVIMRALETDGLLLRGTPQRGKVGQPSVPMRLNPDGVYAIGLKIGRRGADMVLVDFLGRTRSSLHLPYDYPMPDALMQFAERGIDNLSGAIAADKRHRIAGIGIAQPFELWNWAEKVGAPAGEMEIWRTFDFERELAARCGMPTFLQNDATAACGAELVLGRGAELTDFVYFFIGTFVGGGVVLNHAVYSGRSGNAGALGSMPVIGEDGKPEQLIDHASIHELESKLRRRGMDPSPLWQMPDDWSDLGEPLEHWISSTARYLAVAIASACAVIDFEAAIIDGGFPSRIRARIVEATVREIGRLDLQGIRAPKIFEGGIGSNARAIGGACLPLSARYLLDQNVLFKDIAGS